MLSALPGNQGGTTVYSGPGDAVATQQTSSQAINLNVELHSLAVFLSLPFDVTSKAKDQRL